eukprot:GHRQ01038116.1.p1 GENE.GHRQ01038116.1~~GHRQ01038116.1.p1  ORF type:complete len:118 (+),score=22.86 GHRQ01038116.1:570-923(+)
MQPAARRRNRFEKSHIEADCLRVHHWLHTELCAQAECWCRKYSTWREPCSSCCWLLSKQQVTACPCLLPHLPHNARETTSRRIAGELVPLQVLLQASIIIAAAGCLVSLAPHLICCL